MTAGAVFFAACSVLCLAGALATILARNPIRGALGLLTTIAGVAGLFLSLGAQFLAAIQLIVYAGAVVVLFVFVIMLLGPEAGGVRIGSEPRSRVAPLLSAALFIGLMVAAMVLVGGAQPVPTPFGAKLPAYGSIEAVGALLFSEGLVAFELTSALLIVAVVGAIAVARGLPGKRRKMQNENPALRMYHGPVHPRDGARPKERTL